jgi:cell division protease FtsH
MRPETHRQQTGDKNDNATALPAPDGPAAGPSRRRRWRQQALAIAVISLLAALTYLTGPTKDTPAPVETVSLSEALELVDSGRVARAETSDRTLSVRLEPVLESDPVWQATYSAAYSEALISRLLDAGVEVDTASTPRPGTMAALATSMLPVLLLIGVLVLLLRRSGGALGLGRLSRGRGEPVTPPGTRFADVAGCDEAIDELRDVVDFLRHPQRYRAAGATLPRGILLVGPPGTGKTLLARAVAGEAGVPFFAVSGSEFVEVFVGQGAGRVRDLFAKARKHGSAIVFIDEIDAVGRARGSSSQTGANIESENTLNQLLTEMDGFSHSNVIVLAATNRADMLDRALVRAGRFDRSVQVAIPDRTGRRALLELHTRQLILDDDVDLDSLARRCVGMTGADIANLTNRAALDAAKDAGDEHPDDDPAAGTVAGSINGRPENSGGADVSSEGSGGGSGAGGGEGPAFRGRTGDPDAGASPHQCRAHTPRPDGDRLA